MARLPNTYDRRPAPSFGRTRTPAPVVEVDKGAGLIALGAGITDFAGSMAKIQKESDISDAKDRYTKLKEFALKDKAERWGLMLGDNITKDFQSVNNTVWSGKRDELNGTLSEGAQKYFKDYADLADLQRQTAQFAHITQQRDVVEVDRYNSQNKLSIQATAEHARNADEMAIGTELVEGWDRIQKFGEKRGWSADKIEEAQLLQASAIHATVIGRYVDDRRMDAARDWLDRFGSPSTNAETGVYDPGMTEAHRKAAAEAIRTEGAVEEAQEYVEALDHNMSYTDGYNKIKDEMSGLAQENALAMWKADKAAAEFGREDGYREAENRVYAAYNLWTDHEDPEKRLTPMEAFFKVPKSDRDAMDPKSLTAMSNMAKQRSQGQTIHTIYSAWNELMSMSPDEFRAANLNHYVDRISTAHLIELRAAQLDPIKHGLLITDASILEKVMHGLLGTTTKGKPDGTKEEQIAVQTEFNRVLKQAADEKGEALTNLEKDELAQTVILDIGTKKRSLQGVILQQILPEHMIETIGLDTEGEITLFGGDDSGKVMDLIVPVKGLPAGSHNRKGYLPQVLILKYAKKLQAQQSPGEPVTIEISDILGMFYNEYPEYRPDVNYNPSFHEKEEARKRQLRKEETYSE